MKTTYGFLLAFLFACGGDDDGGTDERRISSLSTAEAKELCQDLLASIDNSEWMGVARLVCGVAELLEPECNNAHIDACVTQTLAALKAEPAQCDDVSDDQTDLSSCTVTVGELYSCLQDTISAISAVGKTLKCENLGTINLDPALPPSCQRIKASCPGLVDEAN
jgi:hypothetical protein